MSNSRRAALYLRISLDQTGEGLAVARQREQCAQIIAQRGWTLAGEFVDNSISASDARKNRPGYDALVKAYDAGQFDALVCYDLDRLTRQPRQLEDWIDAAEDRGLAVVTANGEADLTTDGGRLFARMKLAVARSEVERKSARQKAAARQRSNLGRPPLGVRLTGYTPKGEIVPDEAEIVRRMFKMFDAGESLRSIARTLTAENIVARSRKPWSPSTVSSILTNPRYAGRAVYEGKATGVRGQWEPLVSDELFDVVQARLNDPRRKTNRVGTDRRHIGSGLYLCDVCGEPVSSWSGGRYRCKAACINRAQGPLDHDRVRSIIAEPDDGQTAPLARGVDEFIAAVIVERLSRSDAAELLAAPAADIAPLLADIERLRSRLSTIDADYDAGVIDGLRHRSATDRVAVELRAAERNLAGHRTGSALGEVLAAPDPVAAFLSAGLMSQRSVIDALCVVRLRRGARGSKTFDPSTVRVEWRA